MTKLVLPSLQLMSEMSEMSNSGAPYKHTNTPMSALFTLKVPGPANVNISRAHKARWSYYGNVNWSFCYLLYTHRCLGVGPHKHTFKKHNRTSLRESLTHSSPVRHETFTSVIHSPSELVPQSFSWIPIVLGSKLERGSPQAFRAGGLGEGVWAGEEGGG